MKKFLEIIYVIITIVSFVPVAMASIEGSPHDISTKQCNICHTPKTEAGNNPLWDISQESVTYGLYNFQTKYGNDIKLPEESTTYKNYMSSTFDMDGKVPLEPQSLLCLGCHNGILSNIKRTGSGNTSGEEYDYVTNPAFWAMLDSDLTNDHPVGFTYDPKRDMDGNKFPEAILVPGKSESRAIKGGLTGTLYPLYGVHNDQFECTTCHTAHYEVDHPNKTKKQGYLLLRADNSISAMCRDCHKKH